MKEGKERVSACLKKKAKLEEKREELAMTQDLATATTSTDEASGLPELSASTVHRQQVSSSQLKRVEDEINALDQSSVSGIQFVIDNFDLIQNVREMTCESQNTIGPTTTVFLTECQVLTWTIPNLFVT